jgi:hypothetical protein
LRFLSLQAIYMCLYAVSTKSGRRTVPTEACEAVQIRSFHTYIMTSASVASADAQHKFADKVAGLQMFESSV